MNSFASMVFHRFDLCAVRRCSCAERGGVSDVGSATNKTKHVTLPKCRRMPGERLLSCINGVSAFVALSQSEFVLVWNAAEFPLLAHSCSVRVCGVVICATMSSEDAAIHSFR